MEETNSEKPNIEEQREKELLEQKKRKLSTFLKDNRLFFLVFIIAIAVRFYFFTITNGQPLWWDEAEYMSAAKSYAGIIDYNLSGLRLPGFSLFMSIFFLLNLDSEIIMRFFGLLIPSLILILLTYITIKEMYQDKRVAIISTLILIFLWEHLFYSNRFQTENFALIFQLLTIFILFKVYMKGEKFYFIKQKYSLIWIFVFSLLSIFFRPGNFLFMPAMFLFIFIINKSNIFSKKSIYLLGALFLILFGSFFVVDYTTLFSSYVDLDQPLAWNNFIVFKGFYVLEGIYASKFLAFFTSLLFYSFLFGIMVLAFDLFIRFKSILYLDSSGKNLEFKSDLFNVLTLLAVMSYFVFILRSPTFEFRWFFPILVPLLSFTSKGTVIFSEYVGKIFNNRMTVTILILLIVLPGLHAQYTYSNFIIENKLTSYQPVKESGIWMMENSDISDIIFSASLTQHSYYSERRVEDFYIDGGREEDRFIQEVQKLKPKYMVVSIFEPGFQPEWALNFHQNHPELVTPVQIYAMNEQPVLIIHQFNY